MVSVSVFCLLQYRNRAKSVDAELFPGVRHLRVASADPQKVVANFIFINLETEDLEFIVTKPSPISWPKVEAATVGHYAETMNVDIAINGNFFHPFHSNSPWDFYPRAGDLVDVLGIAASAGKVYSTQVWAAATLYLSRDNQVFVGEPPREIWNAVSGDQWLVKNGRSVAKADAFGKYPRSAIGVNDDRTVLILAVVDGKQPGFSVGVTIPEFAEMMRIYGAHDAINLDGGGSATLVARTNKRLVTLNSPIHTRIPGRQRPVANHLGVRIKRCCCVAPPE